MLENKLVDDIVRMNQITRRIDPNQVAFKTKPFEKIIKSGQDINRISSSYTESRVLDVAKKWVQELLIYKTNYDSIIDVAFNDPGISKVILEAFTQFINENLQTSEFISLFIDDYLKIGLKGKIEFETEQILLQTINLFRYIRDKDAFEYHYKNHLAKRLIGGRSVSDDAERGMIAKLKLEVYASLTQRLEGSFKDMKISDDIFKEYKTHIANNDDINNNGYLGPDIKVSVLTFAYWPESITEQVTLCNFPSKLEKCKKNFEIFYFNRHSGRQLRWQPSLGSADVCVRFKTQVYTTLVFSTYAMIVLYQFEGLSNSEAIIFTLLQERTRIDNSDLMRTLQSLACAKYKILIKQPKSRDVKITDQFFFNSSFTAPLQRISIMTIASTAKVDITVKHDKAIDMLHESRKNLV